MKNVSHFFVVLLVSCFAFIQTEANAQVNNSLANCSNWNQVATTCLGACGDPATISYPVLCTSAAQRAVYFCVRNEASSLCPNTGAIAKVYVNGSLVASGDITAVGSSVNFTAHCGSTVKVVTSTYYIGGSVCVWLGQVTVGLRRLN